MSVLYVGIEKKFN